MDADEILVLENGRVAERGTHNNLLDKPDSLYALMWNVQQNSGKAKVRV